MVASERSLSVSLLLLALVFHGKLDLNDLQRKNLQHPIFILVIKSFMVRALWIRACHIFYYAQVRAGPML
jgi:hypothetical protein